MINKYLSKLYFWLNNNKYTVASEKIKILKDSLENNAYDPSHRYYEYEPGLELNTIVERWQRLKNPELRSQKMYDDSMPIILDIDEVWPLREYTWNRETSRSGFATKNQEIAGPLKWDAIKEDMKINGWDPSNPIQLDIPKAGSPTVGEGNHRLAIAKELGIDKIPTSFRFLSFETINNSPANIEGKEVKLNKKELSDRNSTYSDSKSKASNEEIEELIKLILGRE